MENIPPDLPIFRSGTIDQPIRSAGLMTSQYKMLSVATWSRPAQQLKLMSWPRFLHSQTDVATDNSGWVFTDFQQKANS
jgi:hypothetical protein